MANSSSERLKFKRAQLLDIICRTCYHPDSPKQACSLLRNGGSSENCSKCISIARSACKRTSLENESIFENY